GVQAGRQSQARYRKFFISSSPLGVWATSGWNWTPNRPRSRSSIAATGEAGLVAVARNPSGGATTASLWLIQAVWVAARPSNSRPPPETDVRRNSPAPARTASPPGGFAIDRGPWQM